MIRISMLGQISYCAEAKNVESLKFRPAHRAKIVGELYHLELFPDKLGYERTSEQTSTSEI